ncbi:hypothetical protein FHG87_017423 [Trinorchestia longiramus]|nr:hypothetical protein FHG87_017423 [Trinorchestia longiramus]
MISGSKIARTALRAQSSFYVATEIDAALKQAVCTQTMELPAQQYINRVVLVLIQVLVQVHVQIQVQEQVQVLVLVLVQVLVQVQIQVQVLVQVRGLQQPKRRFKAPKSVVLTRLRASLQQR